LISKHFYKNNCQGSIGIGKGALIKKTSPYLLPANKRCGFYLLAINVFVVLLYRYRIELPIQ
jgi:hypothetical protein